MAYLTNKDIDKIASAVANDLVQNDIPLNVSITKVAKSMEMSTEQIKRVCEATNNHAFKKMFDSKKEASDRNVEFPVAAPDEVLGDFRKAASVPAPEHSVDSYAYRSLKDLSLAPIHDSVKIASVTNFELRPQPTRPAWKDRHTLEKVATHLRHKKIEHDYAYTDTVNKLATQFKLAHTPTPFSEFEVHAVALYKEAAAAPLNAVREALRLPQVTYNTATATKIAGVVDDRTPALVTLKEAIHCQDQIKTIERALVTLETTRES